MEEWKSYKLGDICHFQNGYAFKSSDFLSRGENRVVKIKELKDGKVKFFEDSSYVNCNDTTIKKKYAIKEDDILFALTGDPVSKPNPNSWVGRVAIYKHKEVSLLNQRVCKLIPTDKISPSFLYYYFRQTDVFYTLASKATGSASQANISTKTIEDTIVRLPSLMTQEGIASMLRSLDDKIELNNRINHNLEQQAQALYKSWFVNFEPFKNGKFVDSILGMIPEGWRIGVLSDISTITMGQSPAGSSYNENGEGILFYQGRTEFGFRYPSIKLYTTEPSRYAEAKSILMSVRAPVGDINIASSKCCIGRGLASIKPKDHVFSFLLYLLKNKENELNLYNGEGTVFGSINRKELEQLPIIVPPQEVINAFNKIVYALDLDIEKNSIEINTLQEVRDYLLPSLMTSGLAQ